MSVLFSPLDCELFMGKDSTSLTCFELCPVCYVFSCTSVCMCTKFLRNHIALKVKVAQSCPTLCDTMDYTVHGILQARILEWVAFPFSRGSSQPRDQTQVSHIAGRFFTSQATREAQGYWNGYPIPSPADLPDPGTNQDLLYCRRILYQLSSQGSPIT